MRKAISTFVVACTVVAGASGVAAAAKPHVAGKRCDTTYTPRCHAPQITNKTLSPQCVSAGPSITLPKINFVSNAGIKKIQILLQNPPRSLTVKSFKGQGPTQFSVTGLHVPTTGLLAGGHNITVKVTDVRNRSVSKTLRFSICTTKPVFTG